MLDTKFFYDNAGFSYDPKTETANDGRVRMSYLLASAEILADRLNFRYEWEIDPDIYSTWCCTMYDTDNNAVGHLGGIDFGPGGEPFGDDYKRVIEAQLAVEELI